MVRILLATFILFSALSAQGQANKSVTSFEWQFKNIDSPDWLPAQVPGCVHTDLLANGVIDDPFSGNGEADAEWVGASDWVYQTQPFQVSKERIKGKSVLRFDGLDTYAKVFLNDSLILDANNAFRSWEVDVGNILKRKGNVLEIRFASPVTTGGRLAEFYPHPLPGAPVRSVSRKPQYQYGWDWGPALPTVGITGAIELITVESFRVKRTKFQVLEVSAGEASMLAELEIESLSSSEITCTIQSESNWSSEEFSVKPGVQVMKFPFSITNPKLWWPNGLGEQPLYELEVNLSNGVRACQISERVGIRSIELDTLRDRRGQRFMLRVNGTPVFAKGANYIPQHVFLQQNKPADYRRIIDACKKANFNMLRVWGGGIYERELFYDLCDEAGILVWQDFMFACAMYPGDDDFVENVKAEALEHLWRLESHPCMALWCGNNENSEGWHRWGWQAGLSEVEKAAVWTYYQNIFQELLPELVEEHSTLPYWESSPSLGRGDSLFHTMGDAHDWTVWHDAAPFERFQEIVPRFMSEFGFQSYPSRPVMEMMVDSGEVSRQHSQVQAHQKHSRGEALIEEYMTRDFGVVPEDLDDFIYLSQVQQARGIGMGMRAQRRGMPYCMGSLYWQLNDCWPAISWSSIDYRGQWKALQYEAKRAFEPFMVSSVVKDSILEVWCTSEASVAERKPLPQGTGVITLMTFDSKFIAQLPFRVTLLENGSSLLAKIPLNDVLSAEIGGNWYVRVEMETETQQLREVLLPTKPAQWSLPQEEVEITTMQSGEEWILNVYSPAGAYWVQLSHPEVDFSDNYFHLEPGESRKVRGIPRAQNVGNTFSVRHLGQVLTR